jgi:hypothetical protein
MGRDARASCRADDRAIHHSESALLMLVLASWLGAGDARAAVAAAAPVAHAGCASGGYGM